MYLKMTGITSTDVKQSEQLKTSNIIPTPFLATPLKAGNRLSGGHQIYSPVNN